MSQRQSKVHTMHVGRAGWFAMGALAASLAFVGMLVAGDIFKAIEGSSEANAQPSAVVIEGK